MSSCKQGTLEKAKTAAGLVWYLRYTERIGNKTMRPRVRIGLVAEMPSKKAAWKAADPILRRLNATVANHRTTFGDLLDRYEDEAMPERHSTRRGYQSMINAHIRPKWGKTAIEDVRSYETEVWLQSLKCGSRRKGHIHGMMKVLFRFAMHTRMLKLDANPMHCFSIKGATKRKKQPGTISHAQFHAILELLREPYRTMVIVAMCLGLRVSELLGLQWADVDFLEGKLRVCRAVVDGRVGPVKTEQSEKELPVHARLAKALLDWRGRSEFTDPEDFVFASPYSTGLERHNPYTTSEIQTKHLRPSGKAIGLTFSLGWHTFRHSYRVMLRKSGAPMDVQRDLMRHADIQTTMQTYGGTGLDELRPVNETVVESLFGGKQ